MPTHKDKPTAAVSDTSNSQREKRQEQQKQWYVVQKEKCISRLKKEEWRQGHWPKWESIFATTSPKVHEELSEVLKQAENMNILIEDLFVDGDNGYMFRALGKDIKPLTKKACKEALQKMGEKSAMLSTLKDGGNISILRTVQGDPEPELTDDVCQMAPQLPSKEDAANPATPTESLSKTGPELRSDSDATHMVGADTTTSTPTSTETSASSSPRKKRKMFDKIEEHGGESQGQPDTKQDVPHLGTIIEAGSGMDAELPTASDDDARNSKSASPDTSPRQGPDQRQEKTPERIVITPDTPPHEKRHKRQKASPSLAKRANKVISQMNKNVMLTDDVLMELAVFLRSSYPESKSRLLDTFQFRVHEEQLPSQLNPHPQCGEKVYAFLHHPPDGPHWTLCVLIFEDKFIRLDFYDSIKKKARASRVESFFTYWINERYHGSNLQFAIKEAPQQNDGTSCGIFALEIMRRLLSSEDVNQPIEPMEVRRALLQCMTSVDTTSSPLSLESHTLELLQSIQKHVYIRTHLAKLFDAIEPKKVSIKNLLHQAKERDAQTTEKINRLKRECEEARTSLLGLKTREQFFREALDDLQASMAAKETADFSVAMYSGITGDEPVGDGSLEPSAKRPRLSQSVMDLTQGFNDMVSQYVHARKKETDKKLEEARKEALREPGKRVTQAEERLKELTEQLGGLQCHADIAKHITSVYQELSCLQDLGLDIGVIMQVMFPWQTR